MIVRPAALVMIMLATIAVMASAVMRVSLVRFKSLAYWLQVTVNVGIPPFG